MEPGEIAAAAAAQVETPPSPEPPPAAAGPAPWAKDLEERFTDETTRAAVDTYLREKQAPYITRLEQERKELRDAVEEKAWVYDELNGEDPAATLERIAEALYPGTGERIAELIKAGATPDSAVEQAEAESELPPEVAETVEWAKQRRADEATAAEQKAKDDAMASATEKLNAWMTPLLAAETDIIQADLLAYVAASGDMDAAYAAYRENHPKPGGDTPPATLPGGAGYQGDAPRKYRSVHEAAGAIFDEAFGAPVR